MKILHICNDYSYSKVHQNLYRELDYLGYEQLIFNPLQEKENVGKNKILFQEKKSKIVYSSLLKPYHRIIFEKKLSFLRREILSQIDIHSFNLIHATTLFSDGALALELNRNYNIPYIIAVRSTDIDIFLKYRPDLIFLMQSILNEARKIIFISESSFESFKNHYLIKKSFFEKIRQKIKVIPNGINSYWIDNLKIQKQIEPRNILYVGSFEKRKNLERLIFAFEKLQKSIPDINLSIVGGGNRIEEQKISKLAKKNHSIKILGLVKSKSDLEKIYSNHDIFAMVSYRETFGLVYLEALSQGLPIVYSKGQGVSGEFSLNIGEEVNPKSEIEIAKGLLKLIDDYDKYQLNEIDFSKYSWKNIASSYSGIYKELMSS